MRDLRSSFLRDDRRNIATCTIATDSNPLRINCLHRFTGKDAIDYCQTIIQCSRKRMLWRTTVIHADADHFRCRRDIPYGRIRNVDIPEYPAATVEVDEGWLVPCSFLGSFGDIHPHVDSTNSRIKDLGQFQPCSPRATCL